MQMKVNGSPAVTIPDVGVIATVGGVTESGWWGEGGRRD